MLANPFTGAIINDNPDGCNQYTGKNCSPKTMEALKAIEQMSPADLYDYDPYTGRTRDEVRAFKLYEARKLMPKKPGKIKSLKNSFTLDSEADGLINVDGVPVAICKWEDPDSPDDESQFVYAYGEPWSDDDRFVETPTNDLDELMQIIRRGGKL